MTNTYKYTNGATFLAVMGSQSELMIRLTGSGDESIAIVVPAEESKKFGEWVGENITPTTNGTLSDRTMNNLQKNKQQCHIAKNVIKRGIDILGLTPEQFTARTKTQHDVIRRMLIWAMLHKWNLPYTLIAKLCNRNHAAIIIGVRKIERRIQDEPVIKKLWEKLNRGHLEFVKDKMKQAE